MRHLNAGNVDFLNILHFMKFAFIRKEIYKMKINLMGGAWVPSLDASNIGKFKVGKT